MSVAIPPRLPAEPTSRVEARRRRKLLSEGWRRPRPRHSGSAPGTRRLSATFPCTVLTTLTIISMILILFRSLGLRTADSRGARRHGKDGTNGTRTRKINCLHDAIEALGGMTARNRIRDNYYGAEAACSCAVKLFVPLFTQSTVPLAVGFGVAGKLSQPITISLPLLRER